MEWTLIEERHMSRADLARAVGAQPNNVIRVLNNTGGRGGALPLLWAAILEALGLELTTQPRQPGSSKASQ